jgi:hypothetical protein
MAKLKSKSTLEKLTTGILMPMLQHRWMVEFGNTNLTREAKEAMTAQTANIKMDYIKKTISFDIQQPAVLTELACVVADFVSSGFSTIKVNAMDGADNVLGYWVFDNLKALSHHFDLDYSQPGIATHKIEMKYGRMLGSDPTAG